MVKIAVNYGFDFRSINFGTIDDFDNFRWAPKVNFSAITSLGKVIGEDVAVYYNGLAQIADTGTVLLGHDFAYDASHNATNGRLTGLVIDIGKSQFGFALELVAHDFDISLTAFQSVVDTKSKADDIALLSKFLAGNDELSGSGSADYFYSLGGNDKLSGNSGNDTLNGGAGNDQLLGGFGNDSLIGGSNADKLDGGYDADVLIAGTGRDTLNGGEGVDRYYLGQDAERDVIVFNATYEASVFNSRENVYQFSHGIDDIDLRLIDANTATSGNQAFAFAGKTAKAHSVWYQISGDNIIVNADTNGNKVADFSILLHNLSSISSADFLL